MTGTGQGLLRCGPVAVATVVAALVVATGCTAGPSGSSRPAPSPSAPSAAEVETVDAGIAAVLDQTLPPGASGTLVAGSDGELVHCAGFGLADRERHVAATCDTVYDVMSLTKQFTAAAVLRLQMADELQVSDTIGTYLADVPPDKQGITIEQLLTHTAGLVEALGGDDVPLTRDELIAEAMASDLLSSAPAPYHYSNVGYSLLAAIVEIVSGSGYEEFLAEQIFAPAGMTSTGYVLPDWRQDEVAVEYDAQGRPRGTPLDHPWADDGPSWNLRGNGGLLSTARDMYRWQLALDGDEILDEAAKRAMFEPRVREEPGGDSWYGYGWVLQDSEVGTVAGHDGGNLWSFGELYRFLEEDAAIFWVTNQGRDDIAGRNLVRDAAAISGGVATELLAR